MSQANNVTQFPTREDEPCDMLRFADGYLESVFYSGRWRGLVRVLEECGEYISPPMQTFVAKMSARKKRPSAGELGIMVGLLVSVLAQERFEQWQAEKAHADNVVPIKGR